MPKLLRIIVIPIALIFLSACASDYHAKARSAYAAYNRGDSARALKLISDIKPSPRDKLLYLLDRGMILHAAGEYKESNKVLTEAEDLADQLSPKSISREAAAALWSEEATDYAGEKHERVLIAVVRMLNYLGLDDWAGALVEVRRVGNLVEKVYGSPDSYANPFALYLSAIIWEAMGQTNDAMIDYRRLQRENFELPYYAYDLKFTGKKLGMFQKLPKKESFAWTKSLNYRKRDGELIVIVETGQALKFISRPVTTGYFNIEMPALVGYSDSVAFAEVRADGDDIGRTYSFYDATSDLLKSLKRRRSVSIKRKIAKVSTQTALYATGAHLMSDQKDSSGKRNSRSTEEQVAGLVLMLIGASMSAAESAETRSWRTFPSNLQIGRFYLKEGVHDIEILPEGYSKPILKKVEISRDHPSAIILRVSSNTQRGEAGSVKIVGDDKNDKSIRLAAINSMIKKEPGRGELKIERAKMRIKDGDYNVQTDVIEGLLNGGSKKVGVELMVISSMVRGDYSEASKWSNIAIEKKLGSKVRYKYYEQTADYLNGQANDVQSGVPSLTNKEAMDNAFNYFVAGLVFDKNLKYEKAARMYADAMKYGLKGKDVSDRFLLVLKKSPESFKKSPEGKAMISVVAETIESDIK